MHIVIGWWGSHHEFYVCCDKSSNSFGEVFDYDDNHPWMKDDDYDVKWSDFDEFLSKRLEIDKKK
jgi:hypothetical protein